jgi:hypothetical protein
MPQCQFHVFYCFFLSEKLHRKYSQNWTKQNRTSYYLTKLPEDRRGDEDEPRAGHTIGQRGPAPSRAPYMWDHPGPLLMLPLCLYRPPSDGKNLKNWSLFQKHIVIRRYHRLKIGRVQKLFLAPCRRGELPPEVFFIAMLASDMMSE